MGDPLLVPLGDPPMSPVSVVVAVLVAVAAGLWQWAGWLARGPRPQARRAVVPRRAGVRGLRTVARRNGRAGAVEGEARARAPTSDEVAGAMVLLAVALQSGCGLVEAIESTARVAPPSAGHQLAVVAAALRWGVADDQAWAAVSPRWRPACTALRLAAASGVAPSALLLAGANDMRAARLASVEVAAARLGVRLVAPLGLAFLPAFVLTTVVPVVVAVAAQVLAG